MTFLFGKGHEDRAKRERRFGRILSLTTSGLVILAWASVKVGGQASAPGPSQRVLVLYSDERLLPANIIVDEAIHATFTADTSSRIELHSEFLDAARFPGEELRQRQRDFFREKYRRRPPGLLIPVGGDAFAFLAEHPAELFAGVPIVYCSVAGDPHPEHLSDTRIADVPVPDTAARTLEIMLRLHPDARHVAVVSGSGRRDRQYSEVFRKELTTFGNRVAFTWLTNLSMQELRGELSRLPDHHGFLPHVKSMGSLLLEDDLPAIIAEAHEAAGVLAQDKTPPEAYSGVAIGTGGGVGGKTLSFDFCVVQYTTDEEVESFAQLVKDKGTDALRRALEKEDKGRINAVGSNGNLIAVARKRQQGSETIITIVTARNMPFIELYRNGRTTDYPFGYLQVKLDATGKGTGQIMAAARIRFDKKKGQYEIESYGNQYIKATYVRP